MGLEFNREEDALVEHEVVAVREVEVELGAEFHYVAPAQQHARDFGAVIPGRRVVGFAFVECGAEFGIERKERLVACPGYVAQPQAPVFGADFGTQSQG